MTETGPDVTPSSKMPLARVSSLPEPTPVPSWSLDFSTSAVEDNRKSAEFVEEFSSGSEEVSWLTVEYSSIQCTIY